MKYLLLTLSLCVVLGCQTEQQKAFDNPFSAANLNAANNRLLEVAMEDGFPPPIASRVYVYPHIAHYMALRQFYPDSLPPLAGKINGLTAPDTTGKHGSHPELTALLAFAKTAKKVVFSEHHLEALADSMMSTARHAGMNEAMISASSAYADSITLHMTRWISKDNYVQTRTMDRWTSTKKTGEWIETPPDYVAGLEPHWPKIRPLVIDSAGVYTPASLPAYDPAKNSDFYKMVNEVYEESKTLDEEKQQIAWFWDDNPNVSEHRGHLVVMIHKISPPGHWLNIIDLISTHEGNSLFETTRAYTFTAIAMFDAIISCWYVKYKTNLVRPVTYIQQHIDPNWKPLIQTPPFPEYTSGHSAISAAAATVLTDLYGDQYTFTDSTNVLFDQPARSFKSFHDAAWEVSLSRFYAGIHYMNGITEGNKQGKFIGTKVLERLK